jgi:hypothetical protein
VVKVTINPRPTISISPTSLALTLGTSSTLTASGASSYAWTPGTNLSATTGSSVIFTTSAIGTGVYTVTGTDDNGCTNTTTISVVTNPQPFVAGSIAADQTICSGTTPAAFTSTTDASGGTGTISYQWQSGTDNTNFTDISGATLATYAPGTLTQSTYYRRKASTSIDGAISTASVKVTVQLSVSGTISGGGISVCSNVNSPEACHLQAIPARLLNGNRLPMVLARLPISPTPLQRRHSPILQPPRNTAPLYR